MKILIEMYRAYPSNANRTRLQSFITDGRFQLEVATIDDADLLFLMSEEFRI